MSWDEVKTSLKGTFLDGVLGKVALASAIFIIAGLIYTNW